MIHYSNLRGNKMSSTELIGDIELKVIAGQNVIVGGKRRPPVVPLTILGKENLYYHATQRVNN